jgi:hypothetical protein
MPLAAPERLLVAWLVAVLAATQLSRVVPGLPFSAQAATTVMGPVVLLAAPILPAREGGASWPARAGILALIVLNALGSVALLRERAAVVATHFNYYHVSTAELDAFDWLNAHARPEDVALADYVEGNRLGRFANTRVVLGHWSVTPESAAVEAAVSRVLRGEASVEETRRLLGAWRVRWVVYSPRTYPESTAARLSECARRYQERGIAVDECAASQVSPNAGSMPAGGATPDVSGPNR